MAHSDGGAEGVDLDVAAAVGLVALTDRSVAQAAATVDVTTWRVEDAIEEADMTDALGVEAGGDVASEIDDLLDGTG